MARRGTHRHYLHRLPQLRQLLAERRDDEAEPILLGICETMEADTQVGTVAPWYYEALADLYRRAGQGDRERAVLERYARQRHAPGVKPARLAARLQALASGSA
jgi:hypothetical protein